MVDGRVRDDFQRRVSSILPVEALTGPISSMWICLELSIAYTNQQVHHGLRP